jgi:hypothetical protein
MCAESGRTDEIRAERGHPWAQHSIPLRFVSPQIFYAILGRNLTLHMRRAARVVRACASGERAAVLPCQARDFPMAGEAKRDGISGDFDGGDWLVILQVQGA